MWGDSPEKHYTTIGGKKSMAGEEKEKKSWAPAGKQFAESEWYGDGNSEGEEYICYPA